MYSLTRQLQIACDIAKGAAGGARGRREAGDPVPAGRRSGLRLERLRVRRDWALPHFYFHLVTAYDILRHNGFDIGKRDYMDHAANPHIHPRR